MPAGDKILVQETIRQDLIMAGRKITVKEYLVDDIPAAKSKMTNVFFIIHSLSSLLILLLMNRAFGKLSL